MPTPRKCPRKSGDETCSRILKCACEVFAQHGYAKTTIREVARRAGVSVGGVYIYYKSKDALFKTLFTQHLNELTEKTAALQALPAREALRSYIDLHMQDIIKRKRFIDMRVREHGFEIKEPFIKKFVLGQVAFIEGLLKRGIQHEGFRPMDTEATAYTILSCIRGTALHHMTGINPSLKLDSEVLYKIILHGITESGK